jgi:hypothetical protein
LSGYPQPPSPPPQPYYPPPGYPVAPPPRPSNGLAVASMVLGIVGVLLVWIPFIGYLGMICGFVALGLGIPSVVTSRKTGVGMGMAVTGIVLGGLTVILSLLFLVALGAALSAFGG